MSRIVTWLRQWLRELKQWGSEQLLVTMKENALQLSFVAFVCSPLFEMGNFREIQIYNTIGSSASVILLYISIVFYITLLIPQVAQVKSKLSCCLQTIKMFRWIEISLKAKNNFSNNFYSLFLLKVAILCEKIKQVQCMHAPQPSYFLHKTVWPHNVSVLFKETLTDLHQR